MDDTLAITLVITGVFFVGINLFVVYALLRYRHRPGGPRAVHEPESKALERWLIGITTVVTVSSLLTGLRQGIVTFFQEIISSILREDNHIPFMEMPFPYTSGPFSSN